MKRTFTGGATFVFSLVLALLSAAAFLVTYVQAQTPASVTDDDVNRIASQLYCPVCENVSLDVCPTVACDRWRATIRAKLESGWTDERIKDFFVEQYGARVIGVPPKTGLNWLLYAVPPLAAAGLGLTGYFILRNKRVSKPVHQESAIGSNSVRDAYRKKLEDDIHKAE